jgi:hypothetical protein
VDILKEECIYFIINSHIVFGMILIRVQEAFLFELKVIHQNKGYHENFAHACCNTSKIISARTNCSNVP